MDKRVRKATGRLLCGVLLICGLASGCTPGSSDSLDPEQEAVIADALLTRTDAYNEVWQQLDYEKIAAFHAENFTYYRRGVVDTASHADFKQTFQDNVASQITAYWSDASDVWVEVLGPNAGIVAFVFRGGVETPDGAKHDYNGALTYVFERRASKWQIVNIHESAYDPDYLQ